MRPGDDLRSNDDWLTFGRNFPDCSVLEQKCWEISARSYKLRPSRELNTRFDSKRRAGERRTSQKAKSHLPQEVSHHQVLELLLAKIN
jgi:hypothetical protein